MLIVPCLHYTNGLQKKDRHEKAERNGGGVSVCERGRRQEGADFFLPSLYASSQIMPAPHKQAEKSQCTASGVQVLSSGKS